MRQVIQWGVAGIALLNVVTMASLAVAYGWHHGVKPRLGRRRARQRAFERLIAHSPLDNHSVVRAEPLAQRT